LEAPSNAEMGFPEIDDKKLKLRSFTKKESETLDKPVKQSKIINMVKEEVEDISKIKDVSKSKKELKKLTEGKTKTNTKEPKNTPSPVEPPDVPKKGKRGRPKGSKNKDKK